MIIVIKVIKEINVMVAKETYINGAKFETCGSSNPQSPNLELIILALLGDKIYYLIRDLIIAAPPLFHL